MQPKADLVQKIQELEKELATVKAPEKSLDNIIDLIRKIIRAKQGLPTEDDIFSGLIQIKDIRERTRLQEHDVYGHSYMRLLSDLGGDEWEIMLKMANMEDPYFISLDGEQRKEAILMTRARTTSDMQNLNINLPVTNPTAIQEQQPRPAPPQKKSWIPWKR
jgi:hypothetical protein